MKRSRYIAGAAYDWTFFLLPPLVALLLAGILAAAAAADDRFWLGASRTTPVALALGVLVHAHLLAVVFRSHGNTAVFRSHPWRFTAVPIAVFVATWASIEVAVVATVVVTLWDVYHSAMQTFGLARIYDRNAGRDPHAGRAWDIGLNLVMYVGPILGGASLVAHLVPLSDMDEALGIGLLATLPLAAEAHGGALALGALALGAAYVACYVVQALRRARGDRAPFTKVWLLSSTALVSLVAWGFNPWGQAFFIMNLFHAVQYLGLVWTTEGRRLHRRLLPSLPRAAVIGMFLAPLVGYGWVAETAHSDDRALWSLAQTVALMHFWYDGFVWSVRKDSV